MFVFLCFYSLSNNIKVPQYDESTHSNGLSIDDPFYNMQYYPNNNSHLTHSSKIQRQRSLNMEYPDEVDHQAQQYDLNHEAFMYPNSEMAVSICKYYSV